MCFGKMVYLLLKASSVISCDFEGNAEPPNSCNGNGPFSIYLSIVDPGVFTETETELSSKFC